jgi:rfaE bifunctional protein nucleotidyltransferase chain/domain
VAINSDASVRRIKGKNRPIVPEGDRLRIIAALESVDFVTLFNEPTPLKLIRELKPDVLIKGADWEKRAIVGVSFVRSYGGKVATVKLEKGRSTTGLIGKIAKTL